MFWKNENEKKAWEILEKDTSVRYDVTQNRVSALYTWQDNRCDPNFLTTLPVPESHLNISTGFGLATMFWMTKNKLVKIISIYKYFILLSIIVDLNINRGQFFNFPVS